MGWYIGILAVLALLFWASRREEAGSAAFSENKLPSAFLRMAGLLLRKLPKTKNGKTRINGERIREELRILYPENAGDGEDGYVKSKLAYALMILCVGMLTAFLAALAGRKNTRAVSALERGAYGSSQNVTLIAQIGEGEEYREEVVSIRIEGKEYTAEETRAYIKAAADALPQMILGENEDVDHVTKPLHLITGINDNPVTIEWISGNYALLDSHGNICSKEIAAQGELCMLTARLRCQDCEEDLIFYVRLCPGEKTAAEALREELQSALREQEEEDRTASKVELPMYVRGNRVVWRRKRSDNSVMIAFLTVVLAVFSYYARDRDLHKKMRERKRRLLLEYPEFVSQLVLLTGAGMTVRGALLKIAAQAPHKEKMIYRELAYMRNELDSGISESRAYYDLGRRCGEQHYIRLCMLLSQNLKKGTSQLSALLKSEAADAFEERKRDARRIGEEAGTKLLFPMTVMLAVVMTVIMVPAFMSF